MTQPPQSPGPIDPGYGGWTPPPPAMPQQGGPGAPYQGPVGMPYQAPAAPYPPPAQPPVVPQPAKSRPRRGLIATIVAVVALAGGGVASYFAFADSSPSGGATSPQAAVQNLVDDMNHADLLGVLDDLPPGERNALAQPVRDDIEQLKRLHVLAPSANGDAISGITFAARNLTYGNPTTINDHVQTVAVTGGTVEISADAAKLPFSSEFTQLVHPHGTAHQSVDIAQAEQAGGHVLSIATQKVGDRWYPSLFYTIAANATGDRAPSAADRIPASGADSPEDAVRTLVTDLLHGDVRGALALASPDEMGVLHDYGGLIARAVPPLGGSPVSITTLDLSTTSLSGGAVRVGLDRIALNTPNGPVSVTIDGSCFQATAQGQTQRLCADQLSRFLGAFREPSPAQQQALTHLFSSLTKIGVVATQTDGQWYIAPVRTFAETFGTTLSGLQDNDLIELIKLAQG